MLKRCEEKVEVLEHAPSPAGWTPNWFFNFSKWLLTFARRWPKWLRFKPIAATFISVFIPSRIKFILLEVQTEKQGYTGQFGLRQFSTPSDTYTSVEPQAPFTCCVNIHVKYTVYTGTWSVDIEPMKIKKRSLTMTESIPTASKSSKYWDWSFCHSGAKLTKPSLEQMFSTRTRW